MALGQRLFITMSRGAGRLQGTPQALVFLSVLVGMVAPSPAGTRANGTLLASRGWGALLSRSRAGLAGEIAGVNWESGYLVGLKRQRRLYCNVGIGFHLQVPPDGRISGTHEENPYSECWLQPDGKPGGWGSGRANGWRGLGACCERGGIVLHSDACKLGHVLQAPFDPASVQSPCAEVRASWHPLPSPRRDPEALIPSALRVQLWPCETTGNPQPGEP